MRSMLSREQATFLNIIKSALQGERYGLAALQGEIPGAGFDKIFELARIHKLTAMVCDTLYQTPGIREARSYLKSEKETIRAVAGQAIRSAQFEDLYLFLSQKGLRPVVVKGVTIRQLYPRPCYRESVDEDLWIKGDCMEAYHKAFTEYGLEADLSDAAVTEEIHASYIHPSTCLTIDVHAYSEHSTQKNTEKPGNLIWCLGDAFEQTADITINGTVYRTLGYTDHLLYLILHALKHFMYSGFGIRQVCDIVLFAEHNRSSIDWVLLTEKLKTAHAYQFTIAICKIGDHYLLQKNHLKECLLSGTFGEKGDATWTMVDEEPLLHDILEGGLHGNSSISRLHSSNMTLQAKAENIPSRASQTICRFLSGRAEKSRHSYAGLIIHSVFLSSKSLQGRYPYLKRAPFLLPVAWIQRLCHYIIETCTNHSPYRSDRKNKNDSVAETLRLGKERIRLLEQYHIIQ